MRVIDEKGDLFGRVNAVDALAVFLVVVILVFGSVAVLLGGGPGAAGSAAPDPIQTQVVELRAPGLSEGAATLVTAGPVPTDGVVAVEDRSVEPAGGNYTLHAQVRLSVNLTESGLTTFRGERLYIGKNLTLDLGATTITGTIADASEPELIRSPPTPTATPPPTATPTPATPTATKPPSSPTPAPPTPPAGLSEDSRVVSLETTVSAAVADAVDEGSVPTDEVVSVREKTATAQDGDVQLTLRVELAVLVAEDGTVYYRGVELTRGQSIVLDLGDVTIRPRITAL